MNPFTRLFRLLSRSASPSRPSSGNGWGSPLAGGVYVDEHVALSYAAVYACCRVIAEAVAQMPWHVMARNGPRRERMPTHPADWLIHVAPNEELGAFDFRQTLLFWALTWGNGYAEIERDGSLRPIALWPIEPDRVTPTRDERGRLVYRISNAAAGGNAIIQARDMFHLRGPGWDGLTGYSPIDLARKSIGLGLATEQFGASFFGNGAVPGAVLEAPETLELSPDGKKLLLEEFNQAHRGPGNYGKVAYLDGGMKYKPISIPNDAAQFLETRQHQVLEICRWYKVPPHKVYELTRATYNNVEQQQIEFLTETLIPWMTRLEQEADAKLLGPYQRGRLYTKIKPESLLRGDVKSRYEAYAVGRQWGWFSINDVRALEDLDPIPRGGDEYLTPLNMREAGTELNPEPPPSAELISDPPEDLEALRGFIQDVLRAQPPQPPPQVTIHNAPQPINLAIDNRQHHDAPAPAMHSITVEGAQVQVAAPPLELPALHFTLPAAPACQPRFHLEAPSIHIENPITVEAAPTPEVNVTVEAGAAPSVLVEAPVQVTVEAAPVQAAEVTIHQAPAAAPEVRVYPEIHLQAPPSPDIVLQVGEQIHEPESVPD
jgi:HK97 family phage portal protein